MQINKAIMRQQGGLSLKGRSFVVVCLALLIALPLLSIATSSTAHAKYASLVMDADTGRVLHAVNAETRNYPASLTKMMTLYLIFERLHDGRLKLNSPLTVSARAARQPPSKLGLKKGQTITVERAILALVTKSANDVASTVADNLGGGERKFALIMTAKAREIGMSKTVFRNSSGLPHRGQLSTAYDMAILARRLLTDYPQYYHYFARTKFSYRGKRYKNHNKLLTTYEGADGIKTGYIRASGFNLVASVKRDGRRLIGVVFGGKTSNIRNAHMKSLLDKGFRTIGVEEPVMVNNTAPQQGSSNKTIEKASYTAPKGKSWGVQVGAYAKIDPAYLAADKAVSKVPSYLSTGVVKIVPLERRSKGPLYRARVLSLSKQEAYRACRVLKKRNSPCMVLRHKDGTQVAEADQ